MTERLTALLHHEADNEVVPIPDTGGILARARGMRRRRRVGEATAAVVVCSVLAAIGLLGVRPHSSSDAQERYAAATAEKAYRAYGAFAVGPTVYIGNHEVNFQDKIKSLYYTSLGVVVRHGDQASTDAPGPSRYELIRPDGTHTDLDLQLGDRIPGTSPDSPYFTFARPAGGEARPASETTAWQLVAVDLRTGKEVAVKQITGAFTWGGWAAPPVATDGERMWALLDAGWVEFDWSTGTTHLVAGTRNDPVYAGGGHYVVQTDAQTANGGDASTWEIRSFYDPQMSFPVDLRGRVAWLSPDGQVVRVDKAMASFGQDGKVLDYPGPSQFIDLATGKSISIPGKRFYGWTPDGDAFSVDPQQNEITVCNTRTGACEAIHRDIRDGNPGRLKLGGALYES
jgi:hypothetical protein